MGMYFKDKTEVTKVRFTVDQIEYIDRLAKSIGCSRSEAIRFIVDTIRLGAKYHANEQTDFND